MGAMLAERRGKMVDKARMQTVYARILEALHDVIREMNITQDDLHSVAYCMNLVGVDGEFKLFQV